MGNKTYIEGRRKYSRPQALMFSDQPGVLEDGIYVPVGTEFKNFIVLSDHNRSEIQIKPDRIETRKRMINGRMRSYYLADKFKINTSWKNLPSRSATSPTAGENTLSNGISINTETGKPSIYPEEINLGNGFTRQIHHQQTIYVVDNGAAGSDLLRWYQNNPGSFYVWIAYDRPEYTSDPYNPDHFKHYAEIKECFFSNFDYSISKRSGIYDFWDISLELEEA